MPRVRREKIDAESQILHDVCNFFLRLYGCLFSHLHFVNLPYISWLQVEQRKVVACAQQGFSHDLNVEVMVILFNTQDICTHIIAYINLVIQ